MQGAARRRLVPDRSQLWRPGQPRQNRPFLFLPIFIYNFLTDFFKLGFQTFTALQLPYFVHGHRLVWAQLIGGCEWFQIRKILSDLMKSQDVKQYQLKSMSVDLDPHSKRGKFSIKNRKIAKKLAKIAILFKFLK